MRTVKDFKNWILDLVYPPRCTFCGKLTDTDNHGICTECASVLHRAVPEERMISPSYVDRCFSPLSYQDEVRQSLIRYKFHGKISYSETYSFLISKLINDYALSCDIITWVPLSKKRLRIRGYDQARILAEKVSKITGIPCRKLLIKIRHNPAQSGTKSAEERKVNIIGVYAPSKVNVAGMRVILIDDIITTGSTVSECSKILKKSGAQNVIAISAAMDNI